MRDLLGSDWIKHPAWLDSKAGRHIDLAWDRKMHYTTHTLLYCCFGWMKHMGCDIAGTIMYGIINTPHSLHDCRKHCAFCLVPFRIVRITGTESQGVEARLAKIARTWART